MDGPFVMAGRSVCPCRTVCMAVCHGMTACMSWQCSLSWVVVESVCLSWDVLYVMTGRSVCRDKMVSMSWLDGQYVMVFLNVSLLLLLFFLPEVSRIPQDLEFYYYYYYYYYYCYYILTFLP